MRSHWVLIALGVIAFLAISFELARFLTAQNAERGAIVALLDDQARGDTRAVAARLAGCPGACGRELAATVTRARRPGKVSILRFDAPGSLGIGSRTGRSRVAWAADATRGGAAVVQCVTVRRNWGLLAGASVTLLRLSAPLPPEKGC